MIVIYSIVLAWVFASVIKYFLEGGPFLATFTRTGGMPSAHSACVMAGMVSIYLVEGFSSLFFITLLFGVLVIRDSYGVRLSTGEQAEKLNTLLKKDKITVVKGHTRKEVFFGVILGLLIPLLLTLIL